MTEMHFKFSSVAAKVLDERFGRDREIALATVDADGMPQVRTVNAYYEDGSFYVITHARSGKMIQLSNNPHVAVSADWFTAHGIGHNMGYILHEKNASMRNKLQAVFEWYNNGHINEADTDTIILRIQLTDGILFSKGTRYDLEF